MTDRIKELKNYLETLNGNLADEKAEELKKLEARHEGVSEGY